MRLRAAGGIAAALAAVVFAASACGYHAPPEKPHLAPLPSQGLVEFSVISRLGGRATITYGDGGTRTYTVKNVSLSSGSWNAVIRYTASTPVWHLYVNRAAGRGEIIGYISTIDAGWGDGVEASGQDYGPHGHFSIQWNTTTVVPV